MAAIPVSGSIVILLAYFPAWMTIVPALSGMP